MNALQCVAELDCLCTLACISGDQSLGPMVKPDILVNEDADVPYLELTQVRHPCV